MGVTLLNFVACLGVVVLVFAPLGEAEASIGAATPCRVCSLEDQCRDLPEHISNSFQFIPDVSGVRYCEDASYGSALPAVEALSPIQNDNGVCFYTSRWMYWHQRTGEWRYENPRTQGQHALSSYMQLKEKERCDPYTAAETPYIRTDDLDTFTFGVIKQQIDRITSSRRRFTSFLLKADSVQSDHGQEVKSGRGRKKEIKSLVQMILKNGFSVDVLKRSRVYPGKFEALISSAGQRWILVYELDDDELKARDFFSVLK